MPFSQQNSKIPRIIDVTIEVDPPRGSRALVKAPVIFGAAFTVVLAAAAAITFWPHPAAKVAAPPANTFTAKAQPVKQQPAEPLKLEILTAIQQGRIQAEWTGNGKDMLTFSARNISAQPLCLHLAAGQLFASTKSTVALLRSREIEIAPNASHREELQTVATTSSAPVDAAFTISAAKLPKLDALFAHFDKHFEISVAAAQTAVLAVTENLPLSAFAKFAQPPSGVASRFDASSFKADTQDIIAALLALREIGFDGKLALNIDPQLEIEAMIDPLAHSLALRYYGINDEWAYWKHELLAGNGSTRHYALYGIARFYPDVALQMLPKWARSAQTNPVYRASAVQALAETQRPEAVSILRQLEHEFGAESDLGKAAHTAANYLDAQAAKSAKPAPAFRTSMSNLPQHAAMAAQVGAIAAVN